MFKIGTLILVCFGFVLYGNAQDELSILYRKQPVLYDSMPLDTATKKKKKKVKFLFAFDSRRSFAVGEKVKMSGFKIGITIKERHKTGFGIYGLGDGINLEGIELNPVDFPGSSDTSLVNFNFNYATIFYEFVYFKKGRWELTIPQHLGSGSVTAAYEDTVGVFQPISEFKTGAYVLSTTAQFKVFRWFALGTGVGYRTMLTKNETLKEGFRGPIYSFQIKVLLGELYRMAFKKEELDDWK
jgi:hypothetical protein